MRYATEKQRGGSGELGHPSGFCCKQGAELDSGFFVWSSKSFPSGPTFCSFAHLRGHIRSAYSLLTAMAFQSELPRFLMLLQGHPEETAGSIVHWGWVPLLLRRLLYPALSVLEDCRGLWDDSELGADMRALESHLRAGCVSPFAAQCPTLTNPLLHPLLLAAGGTWGFYPFFTASLCPRCPTSWHHQNPAYEDYPRFFFLWVSSVQVLAI